MLVRLWVADLPPAETQMFSLCQANTSSWPSTSTCKGKWASSWFRRTSPASWPSSWPKSLSGLIRNRFQLGPCSVRLLYIRFAHLPQKVSSLFSKCSVEKGHVCRRERSTCCTLLSCWNGVIWKIQDHSHFSCQELQQNGLADSGAFFLCKSCLLHCHFMWLQSLKRDYYMGKKM